MILEMTAGAALMYAVGASRGVSTSAQFVAEKSDETRRSFRSAVTLGPFHKTALDQLFDVSEECSTVGWDGFGALPVSHETYLSAYRLLESLPANIPSPSIGAEPDGHVTMEWYLSPRRTLSISLSPEGEIHYAALNGASKAYGSEPCTGQLPNRLLDLVKQVVGTSNDTFVSTRC